MWSGESFRDFDSSNTGDQNPVAPAMQQPIVADAPAALACRVPGGGVRSEVVAGADRLQRIIEGEVLWFAVRIRLQPGHPAGIAGFQSLTQWKNNGTGAPPLALSIKQNGSVFRIEGGYSHPEGSKLDGRDLGPVVMDTWVTWLLRISFSADPTKGSVSVWRDGVQVVDNWQPKGGTLYPNGAYTFSYWKIGYYRDAAITSDNTVFYSTPRAGESRETVELPI